MKRLQVPRCRRGQSLVEFLVVVSIVIAVFALAHDGQPALVGIFAHAIGTGFDRFLSALSLPM